MNDIRILHQFQEKNKVYIIAESTTEGCSCPTCGVLSKTKHSRYSRKILTGSLEGSSQEITLIVKKFKCKVKSCRQKIFAERLSFVDAYGRVTKHVTELIKILALSTSAEKVSTILSKIGITFSHDSVLRLLRKLSQDKVKIDKTITNVGIDDFAFKKSKNYGTLI